MMMWRGTYDGIVSKPASIDVVRPPAGARGGVAAVGARSLTSDENIDFRLVNLNCAIPLQIVEGLGDVRPARFGGNALTSGGTVLVRQRP